MLAGFIGLIVNITNTVSNANWLVKLLMMLTVWFAPAIELLLLLLFLVLVDCFLDIYACLKDGKNKDGKSWYEIILPTIQKAIMYGVLAIVINAVQIHLLGTLVSIYPIIMSVPILAEVLSISSTIEKYTGISVQEKIKELFNGVFSTKGSSDKIEGS